MTEHTNDRENQIETPSRPEGQDTSENMDDKTPQDRDTEALPAQATPPTQEIEQNVIQRVPEGPVPEAQVPEGPAPDGEVHPAYGIAATRVDAEPAAATVQDAPAPDDTDVLAPLRDPAPQAPPTPVATAPAPAPVHPGHPAQPAQPGHSTQSGRQGQPARPAAQATPRRGPRVGTAVWGLIVIAVGLGILAVSAGVVFDLGAALIVLLGAAGVILVAGSVVSSFRRR